MELEIRPVVSHELKALSLVHHDAWSKAYDRVYPEWFLAEHPPEFFYGLWHESFKDDQRSVSVAVVNERLCGFVRYGRPSAGSKPRSESTGELLTMYVAPDHMGKGIGSRLLEHGELRLWQLGYATGLLFVVRKLVRSVDFYKANGWQQIGDIEVADFGGYGPEVLRMQKVLSSERV